MLSRIFFAFLLVAQLSSALKLELHKDEPTHLDLLKQGKFAEFRQWHTNQRQNLIRRLKNVGNFASGKSKIQEYDGRVYKVNAAFGTPLQNFMLRLDFYDSNTLIADKTVVGKYNESISDKVNTFDSSKSSTYISDDRTFGSDYDCIKGFYGVDTVSFGGSSGIAIKNATFGQLTELVVGPDFFAGKFDGFLGLGALHSSDDVEPIIITAIKENILDKPVYTLWIDGNSQNVTQAKGQLTIGNIDTDHCDSNVIFAEVIGKEWFEFNIDGVSINGDPKKTSKWTGFTEINAYFSIIPISILDDILHSTNARYDIRTGLFIVACDVKFQLSLFIGNNQLIIDEKTHVVKSDDLNLCYLAFEEDWANDDEFILGEPFTLEYCVVYDPSGDEQIGFAKNL